MFFKNLENWIGTLINISLYILQLDWKTSSFPTSYRLQTVCQRKRFEIWKKKMKINQEALEVHLSVILREGRHCTSPWCESMRNLQQPALKQSISARWAHHPRQNTGDRFNHKCQTWFWDLADAPIKVYYWAKFVVALEMIFPVEGGRLVTLPRLYEECGHGRAPSSWEDEYNTLFNSISSPVKHLSK